MQHLVAAYPDEPPAPPTAPTSLPREPPPPPPPSPSCSAAKLNRLELLAIQENLSALSDRVLAEILRIANRIAESAVNEVREARTFAVPIGSSAKETEAGTLVDGVLLPREWLGGTFLPASETRYRIGRLARAAYDKLPEAEQVIQNDPSRNPPQPQTFLTINWYVDFVLLKRPNATTYTNITLVDERKTFEMGGMLQETLTNLLNLARDKYMKMPASIRFLNPTGYVGNWPVGSPFIAPDDLVDWYVSQLYLAQYVEPNN